MRYRIRKSKDDETAHALHTLLFGTDTPWEGEDDGNTFWIVYDELAEPVGYCSARGAADDDDGVFFSRSGLLRSARGSGLQRRMLRTRERWAVGQGYVTAYTYTLPDNGPSIANLLKTGWLITNDDYVGNCVVYFRKQL